MICIRFENPYCLAVELISVDIRVTLNAAWGGGVESVPCFSNRKLRGRRAIVVEGGHFACRNNPELFIVSSWKRQQGKAKACQGSVKLEKCFDL
jgi:hypothetical protein